MDKDVFIEDIQLRSHGFTRENGGAAITMDDNFLRWPNMFDAHSHHMLELSLVKSGSGSYEIGNHMYDLVAGDIFVIGNTEAHRIVLRKGQYVDNLTIHLKHLFCGTFTARPRTFSFWTSFSIVAPTFPISWTGPTPPPKRLQI